MAQVHYPRPDSLGNRSVGSNNDGKSLSPKQLADRPEISTAVRRYLAMRKAMESEPPHIAKKDRQHLIKIEEHSTSLQVALDTLRPMARMHLDKHLASEEAPDALTLTEHIGALGTSAAVTSLKTRTARSADLARKRFLCELADTYTRLTGQPVKGSRSKPEHGALPYGAFLDLLKTLLAKYRQDHGMPMPGFAKDGAPDVNMDDDGLDSAIRRALKSRRSS